MIEVLQRAQGGLYCLVPTRRAADGVGRSGLVRPGGEGVVLALAVRQTDGVDGGQVDHVKAHGLHGGETLLTLEEGGPLAGHLALGAREKFVPCGEARGHPVHHDL